MELRNSIIHSTSDILTISAEQFNEGDITKLAQANIKLPINVGVTGGHGNLSIVLTDVGCSEALPIKCSSDKQSNRFRTITGICNNMKNNPYWGSASIRLRRFIAAEYADGVSVPRGGFESSSSHCRTGRNTQREFCPCTSGKPVQFFSTKSTWKLPI
jgi:hypothetical protein